MKSKKYKSGPPADPHSREAIFAAVPGLDVMEALFASSRDEMFCVKNALGQYVAVNGAFVRRSGKPDATAVLGRTASQLFPPVLAASYEQQDRGVLTYGRAIRDKLELITNADGGIGWYLTQKQPVRDATGRVIAIASVSVDLDRPASDDPRLGAVADAVERIKRDYAEPLRIESLAESVNLSLSQFERKMRALMHVSPRQFLTQTRLEAAARGLRETDMPLGELAIRCGFYDQAQLSRLFRAATGMSPRKYRVTSAQ